MSWEYIILFATRYHIITTNKIFHDSLTQNIKIDQLFSTIHPGFTTISGPSCSKLTTSLVNDSLKFTSSDTQIC